MTKEKLTTRDGEYNNNNLSLGFDKNEINNMFKEELIKTRDSYLETVLNASLMAKEADGPMQSKHDTTKIEQSWLANAIGNMGEEINEILLNWDQTFMKKGADQIEIGSLIFLLDLEYRDKEIFYLVPFAGGINININGKEITSLNTKSPLGNSLLGKKSGQIIEYQTKANKNTTQRFKILCNL